MFKKLVVTAVAIGAGVFLLRSTHLGGYARTAWAKARTTVQGQIPLEFQLETIRNEVTQLVPDMRRNINAVARESVAVDSLREEVVAIRTNLDKQRELVRNMTEELRNGKTQVVSFRDRKYSTERFQEKLAMELLGAKQCADNLKAKEQLLEAREKGLEASKAQLNSMRSQKATLEVQIAQLEAELKNLRLAQCKSEFQLDDSRLSHIKAALADVRNSMKVAKVSATMYSDFDNEFKAAEGTQVKSKAELVKEAQEFLGHDGEFVSADPKQSDKN
jgi:chromosome segregation ATPase